jgi:hypothetical protein
VSKVLVKVAGLNVLPMSSS